jgi:hypothetical protein
MNKAQYSFIVPSVDPPPCASPCLPPPLPLALSLPRSLALINESISTHLSLSSSLSPSLPLSLSPSLPLSLSSSPPPSLSPSLSRARVPTHTGGATIRAIQDRSKCKVVLPTDKTSSKITIVGDPEGVKTVLEVN